MNQPNDKLKLNAIHLIGRTAVLLAAGLLLAGCATGKRVLTAEDVRDDGERNTILFSYDLTLNVTEKYPRVIDTDVVVRCAEPNQQDHAKVCFRVNVPLKGRRTIDGYNYFTFEGSGSTVVQMPYGAFNLDSVGHSVVVGVEHYNSCFGFGFGHGIGFRSSIGFGFGGRLGRRGRFGLGGTSCLPVSSYITTRYGGEAPAAATIDVRPGPGCYAGHLTLEMTDGELTDYSFDPGFTEPDPEIFDSLPVELQDSVRNRVTQPCQTS